LLDEEAYNQTHLKTLAKSGRSVRKNFSIFYEDSLEKITREMTLKAVVFDDKKISRSIGNG
jgi:hypothetical protein